MTIKNEFILLSDFASIAIYIIKSEMSFLIKDSFVPIWKLYELIIICGHKKKEKR